MQIQNFRAPLTAEQITRSLEAYLLWLFGKRRFASDQTRKAYTALNEQFDAYTGVIWQPYTEAAIQARYLARMSVLCTRDRDYWMTKSKIIFDVFVEEMAQQRVMRQFGLLQLELPPPIENPVPAHIHRTTRKGMNRTTADWLVRLEPYVIEWETANTNLWHENHNFDLDEFNLYLRRYMTGTRLRIVEYSHPEELPDPTPSDMYPSYDTSGSRQYAATLTRELYDDVTTFGRSLSSGPLLHHRPVVQPFLERIQNKIRTVYEAITCTRRTDVVQHEQEQPRHSMHRHQPRPRLAQQPTTRPPRPDQPGSSTWHPQHYGPTSSFVFSPQPQQHGPSSSFVLSPQPQQHGPSSSFVFQPEQTSHPAGAYGYQASMSASHDTWGSDQHPEDNIQAQTSQHTQWMNMFSTPPPGPTQDTQHDQGESEIPPRHIRMAEGTQWVLTPIVHVQGLSPSVVQVSEVDLTFDWLKTKFMLKQGLKEDDFVYYVSRKHSDGPGERKLIDITDDGKI
ncbi:uncharacterized protein [Aegilops tauschii subsp. strangulata]|uniref:uncharacterized protein n=1 Tax=Aegilops tauschii subsp. strangulata TaxID=200361 RepID=UPI003CC8E153